MEKQEVVVEKPVVAAGLTVVTVVEQHLSGYQHGNRNLSFFGLKEPVAVILVSATARRAFRVTGGEVSIGKLIEEAPEIRETLERI